MSEVKEIYELTGCCREDCLYDMSVECYNLLIEASKARRHRKNVTGRERLKGVYCQ